MDLNEGLQWQQVTCSRCGRTYRCTPEDDYYGLDPADSKPGPGDGVCFACLLASDGLDVQKTPVRVIDIDGNDIDPLDGCG